MKKGVDLSTFDNRDYQPGPRWKRLTWYWINAWIMDSWIPFYGLKRSLLRLWGAKIGKGVIIKPKVNIKYPWMLQVGDHSWIGERVWIDNLDQVTIGKHCCISQGVMLLCGNHRYDKTSFDLFTQPIAIQDGAWIGAKSTVLPGSYVGENTVIQAGSIVKGKIEDDLILGQNNELVSKKRTFL